MNKSDAKKILTSSISNLHSYRGSLTNQDIDAEVINNACLYLLKIRKKSPNLDSNLNDLLLDLIESKKKEPEVSKSFTDAAMELFPDYYGFKNSSAGLIGITSNLAWDGMWDFLADYFRSNHGIEINEKLSNIKLFSSIRHERYENEILTSESEVDRIININFADDNTILISIAPSLSPKKASLKSESENQKSYIGIDPDYLFIIDFDAFDEIESFTLEMPNRKLKIVYYE